MGASNLAAKRAAKASRRKAIVAQKRKIEAAEATPAGLAANAASLPIRACVLSQNTLESGMGTLILARGSSVGSVVLGAFLLDTFSRGVKDVLIRTMESREFERYLGMLDDATPLVDVEPSFGRKMLRDLVQWSGSLGFRPPRDFAALERLFGDIDPRTCEASFEFGLGGKPLYISSPGDTPSVTRAHIAHMREEVGPDGFDYAVVSS
jgi:hypothetical protein